MNYPISKKEILAQTLDKTGANRIIHCSRSWSGLMVLNYHRIGDHRQSLFDWNLWSATPEAFDQQVQYLSKNFDVVTPNDLSDVFKSRRGRHVLITFDDGYRDNYEFAFPILKSYGVSGTFFLATSFLDQPSIPWWDEIAWMVRNSENNSIDLSQWSHEKIPFDKPDCSKAIYQLLKIYKSLNGSQTADFLEAVSQQTKSGRCPDSLAGDLWMTWDMVREMAENGMSFGGHTVNHPVLSSLEEDQQEAEILNSGKRIEKEISKFPVAFSYPVGGDSAFTEMTQKLVQKSGYQYAFSYYGGYSSFKQAEFNPYDLPRVPVEMDTSLSRFRSILTLPQIFA